MVNLQGASLSHPGDTALDLQTLTVGSDLIAKRLHAEGMVNLRGARIPGQIDLSRARLSNPGGTALHASSCTAAEIWFRETEPIKGIVNLRHSQFDTLYATPKVWPDVVRLENLSYGTLTPPLPASLRLPLLEREQEGYLPHGYEQLAAAYRRIGDDAAARTVQLAKLRHHRSSLPWYLKVWGFLQDGLVGYGFRPLRAAAWLVALLAVGSIVFGIQPPPELKKGESPGFNPFFYTLDLLLPIIDFGQEKAYKPQHGYQYLAYTLIIAGWILATTIAAGITRAISRQ
ncbi:membrane-associated oxidoreductase [Actinomadura barringtoniae]|uniref:Membrane-associated oxidoreductase n=2 Tax=Actinomadura barringtoniae TaxID=1427535 RepID=A0A939T9A9_9ACTN|nr:membrane-associated oxidoreductase [Actinomadura barringtoniae]